MRWALLALLVACGPSGTEPAAVEPPAKTALWRVNSALDELREGLKDFYAAGGRVTAVWVLTGDTAFVVQFDAADPPPVVNLSTRWP